MRSAMLWFQCICQGDDSLDEVTGEKKTKEKGDRKQSKCS